MFVYCAFDKIAKRSRAIFLAENDVDAVRTNFPGLSRLVPPVDLEIYRVGNIPYNDFKIESITPEKIDFDNLYKFPDDMLRNSRGQVISKDEALKLLNIDPEQLKKVSTQTVQQ